MDRLYNILIDDCEFSVRTTNALRNAKISTLGEVADLSDAQLFTIPNFGRKSIKEVREVVANVSRPIRILPDNVMEWIGNHLNLLQALMKGEAVITPTTKED